MTIEPKGWCPDITHPMKSGDGFLVRIKPFCGRIAAADAIELAKAANDFGNGIIDLTNRANLQFRGLTLASASRFAEIALDLGICSADAAVEARRSILVDPLGPDDPKTNFDSHALATALENRIAEELRLAALSPKFGFLIDGGGSLSLAGYTADIECRSLDDRLTVTLTGGGKGVSCEFSEAAEIICKIAHAYVSLSADQSSPPRRLSGLVKMIGEEAIFAAAEMQPDIELPALKAPANLAIGSFQTGSSNAHASGIPFGQIEAKGFQQIAQMALEFGDGCLRMTPWRAIVIAGIDPKNLRDVERLAKEVGAITDTSDPRTRISACTGRLCESSARDVRADAEIIATLVSSKFSALHVSGCRKGCAHSTPADVTLVATADGYDLIPKGRADDPPLLRGLSVTDAAKWIESNP